MRSVTLFRLLPALLTLVCAASAVCMASAQPRPDPKPEPKPAADFPLQAWMKANTAPAMERADLTALASALDRVAAFAPPRDYPNWASIARDGANAARTGQLEPVKAACRSCHGQYRMKYKTELRIRPIPPSHS
ncbi:hypothetical protein [Pendulispora albinea]|uniref:Cytochrome c domain-containing protein n=1 Tax=Pendulispora albinea TaxID=2741071 RepID=A0ABZ2LR76_9BACT